VSKEWEPESIFDVLASDTARTILARAEDEPIAADEIEDYCNVSLPTIYRRIEALQRLDLLTEKCRVDDQGNHYSVYQSTIDRISFEPRQSDLAANVKHDRDVVDRFDDLWQDLEANSDGWTGEE
jgi:DNA-binding transcriptional ArsR family regulator